MIYRSRFTGCITRLARHQNQFLTELVFAYLPLLDDLRKIFCLQ
jgi:hypothetical protein